MVDKDKVRDRVGSKGKSSESKRSRDKRSSRKSKSPMSQTEGVEDMETYGDKLDKFKGSSSSPSGSGSVEPGDFANVLEAIANILFYTEGKMRAYKKPTSKREVVETNVTTDIYEQYTEFVAQNNVQNICEKHGIDWHDDVLQRVIAEQDFEGGEEEAYETSNNVVNISGRGSFDKKDLHKVSMTLGYMLMFSKVLEKKYGGEETPEEKMAIKPIRDISAKCIDFIGTFNVKNVLKKNGISWDKDVVDRISEG